jgi:abortive infection bacteriophage resistance protein
MNKQKNEDNLFFRLPDFIINYIYEYDDTEKNKFINVINQVKNVCIMCKKAFNGDRGIIGDGVFNTSITNIDCQEKFCCNCIRHLIQNEQFECPICHNDLTDFFEIYHGSDFEDNESEYESDFDSEQSIYDPED